MLYIVVMKSDIHNILNIDERLLRTDLERQLWAEVEALSGRVAVLGKRVVELERENAELRVLLAKALKNSSTSSKPPSSDIVKPPKPGGCGSGTKRKRGGQPGHPKYDRKAFGPDEIDATRVYPMKECPCCHVKLRKRPPRVTQQVEAVPAQTRVTAHVAEGGWCPSCGKVYYTPQPASVEKGGLIGPILTAQIAYMKSAMHASYTTIRKYVRDVMGLRISRGQLSKIIQKVSAALEGPYEELAGLLRSEEILHVDETGHKDNGERFWTWVFRAPAYAVFWVCDSRGSDVLFEVLGREFEGILGCDFFSAYRKYMKECDIRVQFCLAHLIREVKFLTKLSDPQVAAYGRRLLEKFRLLFFALHLEEVGPAVRTRLLEEVHAALVEESQRNVPKANEAQLLAQRLRTYEEAYFEFIQTPEVEPTNNAAEQTLRFVVIDRQITQGTRGENGCRWSERIWTVLATCALQGRSAYDYLIQAVQADFNNEPAPALLAAPT